MSLLVHERQDSVTDSHKILLQNDSVTPLGRLRLGGLIRGGRGVQPARPLRVYGSYAVVCILRGSGQYRDASGIRCPVRVGDVVTVFPERAHWYGPDRGHKWDELYLTFEGPLFDLYRHAGLLDDSRPVVRAPGGWHSALLQLIGNEASGFNSGWYPSHFRKIVDFGGLLQSLAFVQAPDSDRDGDNAGTVGSDWVSQVRLALDIDLGRPIDMNQIARAAGVSYEYLRKRFQKEVGVSPARYRMQRRIEGARELLRYSPQMTNRQVAETLGFADEFHFSRTFTRATGTSPRAFRRSGSEPQTSADSSE